MPLQPRRHATRRRFLVHHQTMPIVPRRLLVCRKIAPLAIAYGLFGKNLAFAFVAMSSCDASWDCSSEVSQPQSEHAFASSIIGGMLVSTRSRHAQCSG